MDKRLEVLKLAIERRDPSGERLADTLERADTLLAWVEKPLVLKPIVILPECGICHLAIRPEQSTTLRNMGIIFPKHRMVHLECVRKRDTCDG